MVMHTDEWKNFQERIEEELKDNEELKEEALRQWASYRGQTLTRTGTINWLAFVC